MDTTSLPERPCQSGPVVGVRTTKIYCRTVCRPARAPRAENCVPFLNPDAARAAGYRACKQCRPDDPAGPSTRGEFPRAISYGSGPTPIGYVLVATTARGVCALYLLDSDDPTPALDRLRRDFPGASIEADASTSESLIPRVVAFLTESETNEDAPLDLRGTEFQKRVWGALQSIPRGTTTTYGALARSLGLPTGAARAVGTACGSNPVSLLVPCHRVVREGGGLGGYYWGLERKRALLEMEGASVHSSSSRAPFVLTSVTAVP